MLKLIIFDSKGVKIGEKNSINSVPSSVSDLILYFKSEELSLPNLDVDINKKGSYFIITIVFLTLKGYMGSERDFLLEIIPNRESGFGLVCDKETRSDYVNQVEFNEWGGIRSIQFKRRVSSEYGGCDSIIV